MGKDSRTILVIIIIVALAAIVFWGTGKKSEPVDFDSDPFAEDNDFTPVEIDRRQMIDPVTEIPRHRQRLQEDLRQNHGGTF